MKRKIQLLPIISLCVFNVWAQDKLPVYLDDSKSIEQRVEDALSRLTLEEKVAMIHAQSKFSTPGCPRLGIPELWMSDGPHGIRAEISWDSWKHAGWTNDSCTAFPALTCLAATFNPALSLEYGKAIGEEARFRKKEVLLGPGVNIYRTPLNGRNFEYLGEDPCLASRMVVPYIHGVQQNGVAACLKHFVVNNQELRRKQINVIVSERALREIYFPAFKAGVQKGQAWSVMGAYNKYNNQFCTHNHWLVNKVLKEEWGFDGVYFSDWGSTHDTDEAACNGLDIEMGTRTDGLNYTEAMAYDNYHLAKPYLAKLQKKELPMDDLDDKVRRVLRLNFRTNMNRNRVYGSLGTPEHHNIARRIAEEGIVLLKNQADFFPIATGKYRKIAVIGDNAVRSLTLGGGSSELKVKKEISPLEGIKRIYGEDNVVYSIGYTSGPSKLHPHLLSVQKTDSLIQAAVRVAKDADVVLFFGGLNKNQYQDCEGVDRLDYQLPYRQDDLLEALLDANKNVGVILISGNAVAMPWINKVPALIQSWYLGSEAGNAIANVIAGKVVPSGKLPFSIPAKLSDNGAHHFGPDSYPGDTLNVTYMEDILVGYRWHDTKKIPALFPFGYGLSYTTFKYGKMTADKKEYSPDDTVKVSFTLTNTGRSEGAESVQLYVGQEHPSVLRPVKELKAFDKIKLQPGESKEVSLTVPVKDFAYFDDIKKAWVVEPDRYTLYCGASSRDIKSTIKISVLQ